VKSMVELGGNQGVLSSLVARNSSVERIVCTDLDDNAIDKLYLRIRGREQPITPAVLDCVCPVVTPRTTHPVQRFQCEAVVALALTHHLVLTEHLDLDHISAAIGAFASKYVVVEFMPLGLADAWGSLPTPPWYSEEWFVRAFEKHCAIVMREQLEANRILFVGRKRLSAC